MKKSYLFIAAAAGLMLTACSDNENLDLGLAQQANVENVAVGFDTYLSKSNTTRAGLADVMTNAKLQKSQADKGGFGVFASIHNATIDKQSVDNPEGGKIGQWEKARTQSEVTPDFMWNQGVFYSSTSWTYYPLKYWPNETWNDNQEGGYSATGNPAWSQNSTASPYKGTTRDRVSFFAYAPYVNFKADATKDNYPADASLPVDGQLKYRAVNTYDGTKTTYNAGEVPPLQTGILAVTSNDYNTQAPKVYYRVNYNGYKNNAASITTADEKRKPEESVDLMWGVAPAGGLVYTGVNGQEVKADEGMPLYNLEKPAKDQKIKFLFQHALSRLSLSIVAAVDQIGAGGTLTDANGNITKINVEKVTVNGKFNTEGWLWLNNDYKNRAKWDYYKTIDAETGKTHPTTGGEAPYPTYQQHKPNDIRTENPLFIMSDLKLRGEAGKETTKDGNKLLNESIWDNGGSAATQTEGVLTSEKPLMAAQVNPDKVENNGTKYIPEFHYGVSEYFKNDNGNAEEAVASYTTTGSDAFYLINGNDYELQAASTKIDLSGSSKERYVKLSVGSGVADGVALAADTKYYKQDGSNYIWYSNGGGTNNAGENVYPITENGTIESEMVYAEKVYYSGTLPRYWMVIPAYYDGTTGTTQPTDVTVQITYYVTTDDAQLKDGYSRVQNVIEKTIPVKFESGKNYNLKLILGLTSVKIAAEVSDWLVDGDNEVNLPQNME